MCGIAGFYGTDLAFNEALLKHFNSCQAHRGPDDSGTLISGQMGLAHRRLSILDLSNAAHQPMQSIDGNFAIAFNGEVYNFQDLKKEITSSIGSSGDTQVILENFVHKQSQLFPQLNGMFAGAILDRKENRLWLFRDRLGIKPLYYYWDGKNFLFASELKTLSSIPMLKSKLSIDQNALSNYLHLGYFPKDESVFKELRKFPAGHWATLDEKGLTFHAFWTIETQIKSQTLKDESQALEGLDQNLGRAVKLRMLSDVPLGTFLSGGIDSSLVSALAQKTSSKPIKTFTIGFKDSPKSEHTYAEAIAKHLGTDHHETILSYKDVIEQVEGLTEIYDEPFADPSAIPTLLVSKVAREKVTVALSGDGGDELFLGYGMHQWAKRLSRPPIRLSRNYLAKLLSLKKGMRWEKARALLAYPSLKEMPTHIFSQEQNFFSQSEIKLAFNLPPTDILFETGTLDRPLPAHEKQAFYDLQHYLKDNLLVKVDRASMHQGLEVRVPMLDHRMVEFCLNINHQLKFKNGKGKYLLKKLLGRYVPHSLFNRPKQGFSFPIRDWLQKDLKHLVDQYLDPDLSENFGILKPEAARTLKKQFQNGNAFLTKKVWSIIMLHMWMRKHGS